jgi:hypothetical protein
LDPANFTIRVTNPWMPLRPGTTFVYRGVSDGAAQRDVVHVTRRTRMVAGVRCRVLADRIYQHGHLRERTHDYYVQDRRGTVWYFGEDTAELDARGRVTSTEGTWHAGVDGARPGIYMPAHPRVGEHHRQEYLKGHAEDQFRVVSLHASVTVPFGRFRDAVETQEWSRLEPGVRDAKFYARGIGQVSEATVKGPRETARLVSVRRPPA